MRIVTSPTATSPVFDSRVAASERATSPVVTAPAARSSVTASLTEQFFVEGDRQEASQWESSPPIEDDVVDSRAREFDSFDRVPKQRTPFLVAALTIAAGLGIAAWSTGIWSPVAWLAPSSEGASPAPRPESAPPTVQPPATLAVTPAGPVGAPAAPAPANVAPLPPAVPAPAPAPAHVAPLPPAVPAPMPAPAVAKLPLAVPAPGPAPANVATLPPAAPAPANGPPPSPRVAPETGFPPATAGRALTADAERRSGPLRGFVWSPERRRLVHARLPPLPTESPPPPDVPTPHAPIVSQPLPPQSANP